MYVPSAVEPVVLLMESRSKYLVMGAVLLKESGHEFLWKWTVSLSVYKY